MKPETIKALTALHAQVSAMVLQIESLLDAEESQECQHENAEDQSTMGTPPGSNVWCPDCKQYFSKIEA